MGQRARARIVRSSLCPASDAQVAQQGRSLRRVSVQNSARGYTTVPHVALTHGEHACAQVPVGAYAAGDHERLRAGLIEAPART